MATITPPKKWEGTPTLTDYKVKCFIEWYESALRDSDMATEPDLAAGYCGEVDAMLGVLTLLYEEL